jgi:hypothetical protein
MNAVQRFDDQDVLIGLPRDIAIPEIAASQKPPAGPEDGWPLAVGRIIDFGFTTDGVTMFNRYFGGSRARPGQRIQNRRTGHPRRTDCQKWALARLAWPKLLRQA